MTDGNDNTMGTGNTGGNDDTMGTGNTDRTDNTDNTAGLGKTGRTDTHGGTGLETLAAVFEAEDQGDMFRALRPSMRTAIIAGVTVPGAPGTSRFGGHPDLPADVDWPVNADTGAPLSFIGQFNLTELHGPAADAPVSAAAPSSRTPGCSTSSTTSTPSPGASIPPTAPPPRSCSARMREPGRARQLNVGKHRKVPPSTGRTP